MRIACHHAFYISDFEALHDSNLETSKENEGPQDLRVAIFIVPTAKGVL